MRVGVSQLSRDLDPGLPRVLEHPPARGLAEGAEGLPRSGSGVAVGERLRAPKKPSARRPARPSSKATWPTNGAAVQDQIDGIEALDAPSADQDTVNNMLEIAQQDLNKVKSDPISLTNESFASFAKLAHPYGLTECAPTS